MPAVAALIGGLLSGILGPFVKDVIIQRWNENRTDRKLRGKIEESYLAPLSAASEKLIWRMSEITLRQRTHFLMLKTHPLLFNQYKRLSTLYRIASLLGWIRAMNLELSALPHGGFGAYSPVINALSKVQSAMADGHGVEEQRFCSFCEVCGIDISGLSEDQQGSLAADFEVALFALAGEELGKDHLYLVEQTTLHQEFICRGLLQFLETKGLAVLAKKHEILSILDKLVKCLGFRESLVYREWQDSIGDAVIVNDDRSSARNFRIIGFEEFETLILTENANWISPLKEFIEDVDLETQDTYDQRPNHLREFAKAVAELLTAISISRRGALVNGKALDEARKFLQPCQQTRKGRRLRKVANLLKRRLVERTS